MQMTLQTNDDIGKAKKSCLYYISILYILIYKFVHLTSSDSQILLLDEEAHIKTESVSQ